MNKISRNESGFGAIEGLLIIIIILLVGFIGWYVWHTNKQVNDTYSQASSQSDAGTDAQKAKAADTAKSESASADSTKQFLIIKEWGVKVNVGTAVSTSKLSYKLTGEAGNADGDMFVDTAHILYNGTLPSNRAYCSDPGYVLDKSATKPASRNSFTKIGDFWYGFDSETDCDGPTGIQFDEWKFEAN